MQVESAISGALYFDATPYFEGKTQLVEYISEPQGIDLKIACVRTAQKLTLPLPKPSPARDRD